MEKTLNWREYVLTRLVRASGYSAIVFVALIFFFLLREGLPTFGEVPLSNLLSVRWYPIEEHFGILPLITGSIVVTLGAALIAVPFGIGTAVYISEVAPRWMREVLKPLVELLGGLPSVVLGFLGILILSPFLRTFLNLPTGLTALAGSILLGGIAVPTVVSVAEDALDSVPRAYREGAWALGATRWQTIWRVTLPAARSGVLTAVMLGIGRAIGETMTVLMATGNARAFPHGFLDSVRTMTSGIAIELGEVPYYTTHYYALFAIGLVLFVITFAVNFVADAVLRKYQEREQ